MYFIEIEQFPNYREEKSKTYHLFRYTPLLYSDTAIRKLLRTEQRAYDGGTKAMHRFTSRTPRFDSPRGKELYGRPSIPGGSTAPICRTVRRETVESSGTSELLFGNIDRFDSYVVCLVVNLRRAKRTVECKKKTR